MTHNRYLLTIYSIAACRCIHWATASLLLISLVIGGCSALPDKPQRATLYDFGPSVITAQAEPRQTMLPAVAIDDIATPGGGLDNSAVLYRLGYQDAQELRAYSLARWSAPPAQLVRQRLRDQLSLRRPVYNARESLALNRGQNAVLPLQVRLELLEFSHFFAAPDASTGLVKLRATLVEVTTSGEKLIGQRSVVVERPAPSADAQGGVRALTLALDAAIAEIDQWLQTAPSTSASAPASARP